MEIKEREIKGVYEILLNPMYDERGFFMRTFDALIFEKLGLNFQWVQENHSKSIKKNIIRGLHLQLPPFSETKLIRCINGKILDVFVDLRKDSKTFGKWGCAELSAENQKMILIPRGFAHGYCTLIDNTEIIYKVDNFYSKESEIGLLWNDVDIDIIWPYKNVILSEKYKKNLTLNNFIYKFKGIEL